MALSADDRLILVRVKIERAKKHLRNLELSLLDFGRKQVYVILSKGDPQAHGQSIQNMHGLPVEPFDALAAAGDVIHNLRTALDHLCGQLVLAAGSQPTSGVTGFPIAKDEAAYRDLIKRGKVKGMRDAAIERIERLKPYKGGNDPLWRIHELDNIDKHRTLLTTHHDCLFTADWMHDPWPFLLKASDPHFAGFDEQVEQNVDFDVQKAISEAKAPQSEALLPSLHQLIKIRG